MKNLPYKIDVYAAVQSFVALHSGVKQLNYIITLITYKENGIITENELRKIASMVNIDIAQVYRKMDSYKEINALIKFCEAVNTMRLCGFITLDELRFLRVAADNRIRNLSPARNTQSDYLNHLNITQKSN